MKNEVLISFNDLNSDKQDEVRDLIRCAIVEDASAMDLITQEATDDLDDESKTDPKEVSWAVNDLIDKVVDYIAYFREWVLIGGEVSDAIYNIRQNERSKYSQWGR